MKYNEPLANEHFEREGCSWLKSISNHAVETIDEIEELLYLITPAHLNA